MARTDFRLRPTIFLACRSVALTALLSGLSVTGAQGQIGGMLKKAKKQMEQAVTGAPAESPIPFDDVILELTDARLAQVVSGLEAGRAIVSGGQDGPSLASLSQDRERAIDERVRLHDANSAAIERYRQSSLRIRDCRDEAFGAIERAQQERYTERVVSDPALQQVMMSLAQELAAATQAGDTVAMRRVHRRLQEAARIAVSAADSAAIDSRCGRMPAAPAVLAQIDSLEGRERNATQAIRRIEERASSEEVAASGLDARQLGMARERIILFLSAPADRPARGFSPTERTTLGSRRSELQRYF
ncbi:MAG: hypothetical protein ACYC2K_15315 [Gemmatimonadales bacterium]